MSPYLIAGPAVALIGIVAVFFVMRHKGEQTKSMYSSRRSRMERKVKAARQRTLAPHGRGDKAPTDQEIAAGATGLSSSQAFQAPGYQAPAPAPATYSTSSWDVPAAPAPEAIPPSPPPAPPETPAYAPYTPGEPSTPAPAEPVWTPAPSEPVWTPSPAPETAPTPTMQPAAAEPVAAMASSSSGASWSIVGDVKDTAVGEPSGKAKDKDRRKDKKTATGAEWEVGGTGAEDDAELKKPSAAIAVAQYAVLVVGLVMVLIGVVIMVANSKVT